MATVVNETDDAPPAAPVKKKGVMKYVLIGVGVLALIGVSVGVSVFMTSNVLGDKSTSAEEKKADKKAAAKIPKNPVYFKFDPPFVVNFHSSSNMRFLQVEMEVMTYDQEVIPVIEQNMPVIRNNLIFLLSGLSSEELNTQEGKVKMRAAALAEIQKVVKERFGKPGVEEVYFTSLVMQ